MPYAELLLKDIFICLATKLNKTKLLCREQFRTYFEQRAL